MVEREPEDLLLGGTVVIDLALKHKRGILAPLLSGGHDSMCACHIASQHPSFTGEVYHIDTGIGAAATRKHVQDFCDDMGWKLVVLRSNFSYERFIRQLGFPGPGAHQWIYNKLKDRCVDQLTKGRTRLLITGCRSEESTRRMGHVDPVQFGEKSRKSGEITKRRRVWVAPCYDWTVADQKRYMQYHGLPENPVKKTPLAMSGECFCGAFASPGEIELIRRWCPDVAEEIDRLSLIAQECGTPSNWGTRPDKKKGVVVGETGMMCSGCDRKAVTAGIIFTR
jgi:3'-phosphoadenosine 5'-phosphosulfate sulfotransferase (PAPS reductase)/FAD synthetase